MFWVWGEERERVLPACCEGVAGVSLGFPLEREGSCEEEGEEEEELERGGWWGEGREDLLLEEEEEEEEEEEGLLVLVASGLGAWVPLVALG